MEDGLPKPKRFYWFSPQSCAKQIAEITKIIGLLKYLIKINAEDDTSWESQLNDVLCEYYVNSTRLLKLMVDALEAPMVYNETTDQEEFQLTIGQAGLLQAQTTLLVLSDDDLFSKHGISLTVH